MNPLKSVSLRMRLTILTMAFVFFISGALLLLINYNASNELTAVAVPLQKIYISGMLNDSESVAFAAPNASIEGITSTTVSVRSGIETGEVGLQDGKAAQIIPMEEVLTIKQEEASFVLSTAAKDIRQYSYWVFFAVTLLSGLCVYFWCGKVLAPVQELSVEMQKRTVNTLNVPIQNENAAAEMKQLSDAFNHMIQNLNHSFEIQKQFNANAAHELRTPIAVLQANIEAMEEEAEAPVEEYKAFMDIAKRTVNRMGSLVESLLQMTQLERVAKTDFINITALLQRAVNEGRQAAETQDICIETSFTPGDFFLKGNETLFFTAVYNLIENGIKYNQNNGSISVKLTACNDSAVITVSDTGVGISPEEIDAIFQPFYRVDKSRARGLGGAGMGLNIVKHIVEYHGGAVLAKSQVGMGSSFEIQIPLWMRTAE